MGKRGQFDSRVDGMVGGGGGRSARVITREENRLVSLQAESSRCGGNRASSDLLFVFFCLYCAVYVIMDSYSFSYSSWCTGLPSEIMAILDKEWFTSLALLKHATEDDSQNSICDVASLSGFEKP